MAVTVDLAPLAAVLPTASLVSDVERMDKYRWDRALDPDAGTPLAVVRATSTADVQAAVRFAAEHGIGVVPRGAGTGLSGGATAQDGCLVVSTERMTAIEIDPMTRTAVVEPGRAQRRGQAGRRRPRALVPARPVVVRDLLDRRQRRHQRRRAVLREVRRHQRLRARADRRARRRHRRRARRAAAQGRRRAVADQAVRRQRGHARHRHPRRAAAGAGAAGAVDAGGDLRLARRGDRRPSST